MNNVQTNNIKQFKRALTLRIILRFFATIVIFTLSLAAFIILGYFICTQFTWYTSNPLYWILLFIRDNIVLLSGLICIIGYFIIFVWYWGKTLGYLENIIDATKNVYNSKDNLIELPSDLKEVEHQLNQIKLTVQENERAAREAEQRKNDLVVYLAHDLKTPLTSVIGYLTLLRDERQISEELQEKYLSISLEKAERLEDLINEFFEITRFNLSSITLELGTVNLTRMLEQITFEFQPMLSEKNLTCTLNTPTDLSIKCDVNKLQRVFDNLLRNAVNYSFEDSRIEITVVKENDSIILTFLNHGNTIPEEKLNRIFHQFYRLDSARTTKSGGAGLGLAIAKEIIELHGGQISASSKDEIIIFEVTLPIS